MEEQPEKNTDNLEKEIKEDEQTADAAILSEDESMVEETSVAVDYTHYTKEQFITTLAHLKEEKDVDKAFKLSKTIKPFIDKIKSDEYHQALEKFIHEGGEEADFDYRYEEWLTSYEELHKILSKTHLKKWKDWQSKKEENLKIKTDLLEKLRGLLEAEETGASIAALKEIQAQWKEAGPVPNQHNKNLWANYNALIQRFYDKRSIYFELKEFDRKKNLEIKLALCEKAEKLDTLEDIKEAVKVLSELHAEFRHIGPVPQEKQEEVWERFKKASDKIHEKRKSYYETIRKELEENMAKKRELIEQVNKTAHFESVKASEWSIKTKEILEIQKQWEAIGHPPREHIKEINKLFWTSFKDYFNRKNAFFKSLDEEREKNLAAKQALLEEALMLKDSEEWNETTDKLKKLQAEWKKIGPVPRKFSEEIYQQFKKTCDHFFEKKRTLFQDKIDEYAKNLKEKELLCEKIEKIADEKSGEIKDLDQIRKEWNAIGYVPKETIQKINNRYSQAIDKFLASLEGVDKNEKEEIKFGIKLNQLKKGEKLHEKEYAIKNQINKLKNDIDLWKNNMEFFARSKTAEKLKAEFTKKVELAEEKIKTLEKQLKMIREVE